jgi:hypothetical protein
MSETPIWNAPTTTGQKYRMELRSRAGSLLAHVPFSNLQGEFYVANKPDQIRFELPLRHSAITSTTFQPGITECWLYRREGLIYAGPLWDATISSEKGNISCASESLESYFEMRHVPASDPQTVYDQDQGAMAWGWISSAQAIADGNLFITQGSVPTSRTRKRTVEYRSGLYILDEINEMAELEDGFDWKILPNRTFNVWNPRRVGTATARLEYPGTIKKYSWQRMGKWVRNKVIVHGAEDTKVEAISTTSRTKYGLREFTESATNLESAQALTARANYVRDSRQEPRVNPALSMTADINPFEAASGIKLGDTVKIVINDGPLSVSEDQRLVGFQVSVGKQQNESFVFYMNESWEV